MFVDDYEVATTSHHDFPGGKAILLLVQGREIELQIDEALGSEPGRKIVLSPKQAMEIAKELRTVAMQLRRRYQN